MNKEQYQKILDSNERKSLLNKQLNKNHKTLFKVLKYCVWIIIISNFIAVLLTNIMVTRTQDVVLQEANPLTAKTGGYQLDLNWKRVLLSFLIHFSGLGLLFGHYLWVKNNTYSLLELRFTTYAYGLMVILFCFDAINNIGYMIGGLIK